MKKKILAVGFSLITAAALTALCACNTGGNASGLKSANDVYGMGAVSTVRLLGATTSAQALAKFSQVRSVSAKAEPSGAASEAKAQAEKFNEYFTALDSFMSEEIVTTMSEKNADSAYPYETKLTIDGKDFDGNDVRHVMYFTETLKSSEQDEDETEEVYTLQGVLVVDGADYHLEGERSIESEEGETENELEIRAYADITDKTSYVKMEQEHSVEEGETETEYVYGIYSKGVLVEETAIEFETEKEGDKEEVEYELEFRKGEARGKYVVERETVNGKVQIKVEYDIDGKRGEFRISRTTGENGEQYEYSFDDNTKLVF